MRSVFHRSWGFADFGERIRADRADAVSMQSFTTTASAPSIDEWARIEAGFAIDAAITAMNAAGATLVTLTADTEWASDGVRALHTKIVSFRASAQAEIGTLSSRAWEIGGAAS
ncbi:MAG: hypothetical protein QM630_04455 [Microbacterium sp.]